jgi:hypothetical protein
MPDKEFEGDDPFEFVAVRFPVDEGVDIEAEMARCFVEDYALMGMPRQKMIQLFRSPHFAGTHSILQSRGEPFVQAIIDRVYGSPVEEVH